MDQEQMNQYENTKEQHEYTDIPGDFDFSQTTYDLVDQECNPSPKKEEKSEGTLKETEDTQESTQILSVSEKTKFITTLLKKGSTTEIQISDFTPKQQELLKTEGIIDEQGLNSEKLDSFKKALFAPKGLLDKEGNLNGEAIKNRERKQTFLQLFEENPEQALQFKYLLRKNSKIDQTELNAYQDLLQKFGCYQNNNFNGKNFETLKKEIQRLSQDDHEFADIMNLKEQEIIKMKQNKIIEKLSRLKQVKAGENLFDITKEALTNNDDTGKLFHNNEDFFKAVFTNKIFFTKHLPHCFTILDTLKPNEKVLAFQELTNLINPEQRGILTKMRGLSPTEKQKEFMDIILHPEKYADKPEEAQARKTIVLFFVSKLINQDFINTYTQKVYAQQILKEQVNTEEIFTQAITKNPSTIIATNSSPSKNASHEPRKFQKPSETYESYSGSHTKGNYEKGTFTSSTQTGVEIVEEYFETDNKFAKGFEDLENKNFEDEIQDTLIKTLKNPKNLIKHSKKYVNLNIALKISHANNQEEKNVHFDIEDFFDNNQISDFISHDFFDTGMIKEKIGQKLKKVGVSSEEIGKLTNEIFPQIEQSLRSFHENAKKQQTSKNMEEMTKNFELNINKRAVGYIINLMKYCLTKNTLTAKISLENKENKSGEIEGLSIKGKNIYLTGSLDNSPCNLCYNMETGELKINSCCNQKDAAFYFNQPEPNLILTTFPPFKKLQHQALENLSNSDTPQKQEDDIFNLKQEGTPEITPNALDNLALNATKNEFYNVLLDNIGYNHKVISSSNEPGLHLYKFIETFEKVHNKEKIQHMTSFLQELKTLTNLPHGLDNQALQKTDSKILALLFNQEEIEKDQEFGENNSVFLILEHFIQPDGPGFNTFNTTDAQKYLQALKEEKGENSETKQKLKDIEDHLFFQNKEEPYRRYANTQLSHYLNEIKKKDEKSDPTGLDRSSAFGQQFTPHYI